MKHGLNETCQLSFSTLANPTRLAILELLRGGPKNVTEISETLNQEQSMISHNLKPLERCRFVFSDRKKEEAALLLPEQRNKGTAIQDVRLPRQKILPNRRKMPNGKRFQEQKKKDASSQLYLTR